MSKLFGLLLILVGIGLGLYVGGYLLFIGGVVQIITAFQVFTVATTTVPSVAAMPIAFGLLKILMASIVGWIIFIIFFIPGFKALLK